MQPTLYLMLGYPGAGKTTTAEIIARLTGAVHLASDKIRLEMFPNPEFTPQEHATLYKAIDEQTEQLLQEGKSVIYDANLNRYQHRKEKYDICVQVGAKPLLVWVQADEELAKQRATQNSEDNPKRPYGNLNTQTFDRLVREIEPPRGNEPHITLDGTRITLENVKKALEL